MQKMYNLFINAPIGHGSSHFLLQQGDRKEVLDSLSSHLPEALLSSCYIDCSRSEVGSNDIFVRISARLLGGKGGFGSQLRAAGGRKGNKKVNTEAMKDISGRRLRTLQKAQAMAEALRDAPEREREARKEKRDKLLAILNTELPGRGGRRERFDDENYITQSEEILEDIRSAIAEAAFDCESSENEEGASGLRETMRNSVIASKAGSTAGPRRLAMWDEDEDEDASDESDQQSNGSSSDKGKGRAIKKRKTG